MLTRTRRAFTASSVASLLVAALLTAAPAPAATGQAANNQDTYQGYITGSDIYVRSGAGGNYYPFGKLNEGDIVTVVGELYGWSRIYTRGPAFDGFYGYVKAGEVDLARDGTSAITLGRSNVYAPNIDRNALPSTSWQRLIKLDPDKTIRVLGSVQGDDGKTFLKVVLPETADGWVSSRFVRRATAVEIANAPNRPARPIESDATTGSGDATTTTSGGGGGGNDLTAGEVTQVDDTATNVTTAPPAADGADTTPNPTIDDTTSGGGGTAPPVVASPEEIITPLELPRPSEYIVMFGALEDAYEAMKAEPIRTAEIEPLLRQYQALKENEEADAQVVAYSGQRAEMLETRLDLQTRLLKIQEMRHRSAMTDQAAAAAKLAIDAAGDYVAVGRLESSSIYNGDRLPRLLRLVDVGSGRTVAYVEPDAELFDIAGLIGQLVGIVGEKGYDGGYRLTLIKPRHFDLLTTIDDE